MSQLTEPPSIYQLRITLREIRPLIWRRLLICSDTTGQSPCGGRLEGSAWPLCDTVTGVCTMPTSVPQWSVMRAAAYESIKNSVVPACLGRSGSLLRSATSITDQLTPGDEGRFIGG